MLRPRKLTRSRLDYYINNADVDYYTHGGEPAGRWWGISAEKLGLAAGSVATREQLINLFEGRSPDGANELVGKGRHARVPAYDLCFQAEKTVSILWGLSDDRTRRIIQKCHDEAVKAGLSYLQDEAAVTRRGKGGSRLEKVGLAVATFQHGTSRAEDPHLHTHALVVNVCVREDGTTGAIHTPAMYERQRAAGSIYRAELSRLLSGRLGLEQDRRDWGFQLRGVPLRDEFSKRRTEVLEKLGIRGKSEDELELGGGKPSAQARDRAAVLSRSAKTHRPRNELISEWQEFGRARGFGPEEVGRLIGQDKRERDPGEELRAAVAAAFGRINQSKSNFTDYELTQLVAEEAQTRGCLSANDIRLGAWAELEKARRGISKDIVHLGQDKDGRAVYSTRELVELEKGILATAERTKRTTGHRVSEEALSLALVMRPTIKPEQAAAVRHITQEEGSIKLVRGLAGTGKTYMLDAARLAWEADGFKVVGCALSGKAARGLSTGANIDAFTVRKLINDLDAGESEGQPNRGRKPRIRLDSRTVLLMDEAAMTGTKDFHRIVSEVERAGAKLVLVGDSKQLQSIEAGGAFSGLSNRLGCASLTRITRQRDQADRQAALDFEAGNAGEALRSFARRGRLLVGSDWDEARELVVSKWWEKRESLKDNVILTTTNEEAWLCSRMAQERRLLAGDLGTKRLQLGGGSVYEADRILFTRTDSRFGGIANGDLGTVIGIRTAAENAARHHAEMLGRAAMGRKTWKHEPGATLEVRLDDGGRVVSVPLAKYEEKNIRLGYAVTTHKAQGATVENAFVLAGDGMTDLQMSYVQVSRARNETYLVTSRDELGEDMEDLARRMSKSNEKRLAHDMTIELTHEMAINREREQDLGLSL